MEDWDNGTTVTEFLLAGFPIQLHTRTAFFLFFLVAYSVAVGGTGLIEVLIAVDPHLHTPMYFFLSNLSITDVCFITTSVPQILAYGFTDKPIIPLGRCFAQMSISPFFGITECLLLAVMGYDRYVAICSPLHYSLIMSWKVCIILAVSMWVSSFLVTLVPFFNMPAARFCGHNVVNHFACELRAMLKLTCSDTHASELNILVTSIFTLLFPFSFIVLTYGRIGLAVLRIRSAEGRRKALSTCGSHLAVVCISYGTAMAAYLPPQAKTFSDGEKILSIFYGIVAPMLNPLIYSLRNRDVKEAFWRMIGKKTEK